MSQRQFENADLDFLNKQIKLLSDQKGKISRAIGEKKKNSESVQPLIDELKTIAQQLKDAQKQKKKIKQHQSTQLNSDVERATETKASLPQRFYVPSLGDSKLANIEMYDESNSAEWDCYIDTHPAATPYHTSAFRNEIIQSFGHRCDYYIARDQTNKIIGILPTVRTTSKLFGDYVTSIPFFNYGGPLADNSRVATELFEYAGKKAIGLGADYLEVRETFLRQKVPCKDNKVSMILPLPGSAEQLWSDLGTKLRAQINKGREHHFDVKFGGVELLDDYYRVFSQNMRDLGTPVYSKRFFLNLLTNRNILATLVVQYFNGRPVSCAFLLGYKDTLEIPWASTLRCANKLNANMVLYWHVLKKSCQDGYSFFDFGRSSKDASTYRFKKQWGAKPVCLYWHYYLPQGQKLPELNPNNPKYKLFIALWRRLPVMVANLVGPSLVKYLP